MRYAYRTIVNSCIYVCLVLLGMSTQATAQPPEPVKTELVAQIDRLLDSKTMKVGFQGILIQQVGKNQPLYERNADRVFLPASNNKLLTGSAALALLGPDFTYKTRVETRGTLHPDGVLEGDLILHGAGDPILRTSDLTDLAAQIVAANIKQVQGRIRYDGSCFDDQEYGDGWTWDDEPYYYAAPISALNIDTNVVRLTILPGAHVGEPVTITATPASSLYTFESTAITGKDSSPTEIHLERRRDSNTFVISGRIALSATKQNRSEPSVTLDRPAPIVASVFSSELQKAGVKISNPTITAARTVAEEARTIAVHTSPPLSQLLVLMNKPSDNLMAECLLKTIGSVRKGVGTSGYSGTGASEARSWLGSIGLDLSQLHQADGSGLSRLNYISPANLVHLLQYWHTRPEFDTFYRSLPIAGVDGTLRNRMKGTHAEANCHAKTGSLSHVSALSGYVTTRDGVMLVFSILMNNQLGPASECTQIQNRIVALLADMNLHNEPVKAALPSIQPRKAGFALHQRRSAP